MICKLFPLVFVLWTPGIPAMGACPFPATSPPTLAADRSVSPLPPNYRRNMCRHFRDDVRWYDVKRVYVKRVCWQYSRRKRCTLLDNDAHCRNKCLVYLMRNYRPNYWDYVRFCHLVENYWWWPRLWRYHFRQWILSVWLAYLTVMRRAPQGCEHADTDCGSIMLCNLSAWYVPINAIYVST